MKKIILMIVVVTFMANYSSAQNNTDFRTKLRFGLKAGANYSNVYDTKGDAFHADARFGLAAGAFAAIPINKYIGIQPEILFSQKGFQGSGIILGSTYDFKRTLNFIDVPILFALKPSEFITIFLLIKTKGCIYKLVNKLQSRTRI